MIKEYSSIIFTRREIKINKSCHGDRYIDERERRRLSLKEEGPNLFIMPTKYV